MIFWILQITTLSLIFIAIIHYIYIYFKDNLTIPKVKDLVDKPTQQYDKIYKSMNTSKTNTENMNHASIKEGAELVFNKFIKLLDDTQVKSFGEPGDLLDANLHDAMMTKSDKKKKDGEILEVFEKGYRYKEKVIRHAKVIVNKR